MYKVVQRTHSTVTVFVREEFSKGIPVIADENIISKPLACEWQNYYNRKKATVMFQKYSPCLQYLYHLKYYTLTKQYT